MPSRDAVHSQIAGRLPYLNRLVETYVPDRSARILDLGCGYGALLHVLEAKGFTSIVGVDVSEEQVEVARQLVRAPVKCEDLMEFLTMEPAGSWEVIFALDVLEHFERPEVLSLVEEIARVLVPGGRLIIHVPNGEAISAGVIRYGDLTHELAFTQSSLKQLANSAALTLTDCEEDKPIVHGAVSAVRRVLWSLLTLAPRVLRMAETGCRWDEPVLSQNILAIMQKRIEAIS